MLCFSPFFLGTQGHIILSRRFLLKLYYYSSPFKRKHQNLIYLLKQQASLYTARKLKASSFKRNHPTGLSGIAQHWQTWQKKSENFTHYSLLAVFPQNSTLQQQSEPCLLPLNFALYKEGKKMLVPIIVADSYCL